MALYLVTHKPKAKLAGHYLTRVVVVEAFNEKHAVEQYNEGARVRLDGSDRNADRCKPTAARVNFGQVYYA